MTVPFAALDRRYRDWTDEIIAVVAEVADADEFILESRVSRLEAQIAERIDARHAIACASGTDALVLALTAMGIGHGDEVVIPALSFIASVSAVLLAGAVPVFADVDLAAAALDPEAAEAAVSSRTRAVLATHMFRDIAPMADLRSLASRRDLRLVEDSAVVLGGAVDGRPAGRWGDAGVFSFHPANPLGGCGDGGMVITNDEALASAVRALRNHGQSAERFRHDAIGFNSRMDEIVAGFLLRRLPHLDDELNRRLRLAGRYDRKLAPLAPTVLAARAEFGGRAVHTYVIRAQSRDMLRAHLAARGIETVVCFPLPLHLQPTFAGLGYGPGDFQNAERLARECLALPLNADMDEDEVDRVVATIAAIYGGET